MLFLCLLNYFLASLVGRITHRISRILNLNVINPHPEISHGEEVGLFPFEADFFADPTEGFSRENRYK